MSYVGPTELDALLDRVREMRTNPVYPDRDAVAYDCYRMFEDLATRYKEEFAMRDRYKAQSDSWRDKALEQSDTLHNVKNALRDALDVVEVCAGWLRNAEGNAGDPSNEDAAKACDECVAYARSLGVRRNCPGKDIACPCQDGDACHYEGPNAWPIPEGINA